MRCGRFGRLACPFRDGGIRFKILMVTLWGMMALASRRLIPSLGCEDFFFSAFGSNFFPGFAFSLYLVHFFHGSFSFLFTPHPLLFVLDLDRLLAGWQLLHTPTSSHIWMSKETVFHPDWGLSRAFQRDKKEWADRSGDKTTSRAQEEFVTEETRSRDLFSSWIRRFFLGGLQLSDWVLGFWIPPGGSEKLKTSLTA